MQAIILAAGMGKRLGELTKNNTKCMVKVNNETLIERLLSMLDKKGLSNIVVVVGYEGERLIEFIGTLNIKTTVTFVHNTQFATTNNIYSLALANQYLISDDTLLIESDIIFEESILDELISDNRETLAVVDKFESWMDGTCLELDEYDNIVEFIPGKYLDYDEKDRYYKTVNIYKFSKKFSEKTYVPFIEAYRKALGQNEYYESVIKLILALGTNELKAMRVNGKSWYEIDDIQDLDIAETLFVDSSAERYDKIVKRYGGYWRYPKMMDFCYLVNPYYPTQKMYQEIKSNISSLVSNYPSGMVVNSLLGAKNFGVKSEHVVVGNGAAELIKAMAGLGLFRKTGIIRPTFEEYPNRLQDSETVVLDVSEFDFMYDADIIIEFFDKTQIDSIIIINPDNPSGNNINREQLLNLIRWAKKKNIVIIIDESFSDFSDVEEASIISEDVIAMYNKLFVIKSISKSYGVPGLRLGVLVSTNEEVIEKIKKEVSIWNINSLAEFYMQICGKYDKDYRLSLEKIRAERHKLIEKLSNYKYLRVYPSQANYIMCEVTGKVTARQLSGYLLENGILIKDLTSKMANGRDYIRIAIKSKEQNEYLIECINKFSVM